MTNSPEPKLIDTTVKEGGYRVHHHLLPEQVASIALELQRSNLQYMEVSHGRGIGAKHAGYPALYTDKELLIAARQAAPKLTFIAFLSTFPYSLMELELIADLFEIGRVGINPDEGNKGTEIIKKLKEHKKIAIAQLIRMHLRKPEEIACLAQNMEEAGADIVYLTDTFGSMNAEDVRVYINSVRTKINVPIGFQGHNHTNRAIDNTLIAFEEGADWLDGSILGMGLGGGMTSLEILITLLKQRNLCKKINLEELTNAAKWQVLPALHTLPNTQLIDLICSKYKIDLYPPQLLEKFSEILEISVEDFILALKKKFPQMTQLRREHLTEYLKDEKLDYDVVMEYLTTGKI